jgi:hypothetical protein
MHMFGADVLTFREFVMNEPLPLSTIHGAVLEFLRDRDDAVLFGAQAVNAYVSEPRMTEDVDIVISYHQRRGQPKSGTDWRDLAVLLLTFPDLKRDPGPVTERLRAAGASPEISAAWREIVSTEIIPTTEEDEFEP